MTLRAAPLGPALSKSAAQGGGHGTEFAHVCIGHLMSITGLSRRRATLGRRLPPAIPVNESLLVAVARSRDGVSRRLVRFRPDPVKSCPAIEPTTDIQHRRRVAESRPSTHPHAQRVCSNRRSASLLSPSSHKWQARSLRLLATGRRIEMASTAPSSNVILTLPVIVLPRSSAVLTALAAIRADAARPASAAYRRARSHRLTESVRP